MLYATGDFDFVSLPTQSPVALAISSPTFLGDRPKGPILGARAEEAPTSPPVARRVLLETVHQHYCNKKHSSIHSWDW